MVYDISQPKKSAARDLIVPLRKQNHSVYEISQTLKGFAASFFFLTAQSNDFDNVFNSKSVVLAPSPIVTFIFRHWK